MVPRTSRPRALCRRWIRHFCEMAACVAAGAHVLDMSVDKVAALKEAGVRY